MSLDRDPHIDVTDAPVARLGGREFPVPPLKLRRILAVAALQSRMAQMRDRLKVGEFDDESFAPAIEILRQGLLGAHPDATADDLLDMPITIAEVLKAIETVIIPQAGGRAATDGEAPGEPTATGLTSPTGENSSPTL